MKLELTKDHQVLAPYSIHDAVVDRYQYDGKLKRLEMYVTPERGEKYRIIIYGIQVIKVEFWEALVIFTLFAFNADNVSVHDDSLDRALDKLFYHHEVNKNFQEFTTAYSGRYLFYLTSSYGGEVATIADSIEFLPLTET